MATDVSNAVGTARQFTPQPDNTYQGRYRGLDAIKAQPADVSRWAGLAQSMVKLENALGNYLVSHEKNRKAVGTEDAEAMVNSESIDDIKKLNAIDAAQLYGYESSANNPYFKAHAEKIRGQFLNGQMKLAYDEVYGMTPAESADEELRRFNNFAMKWKRDNCKGSTNDYAFNRGWSESNLITMGQVSAGWEKQKHENDVGLTIATTTSALAKEIENSVETLRTEGQLTKNVQQIVNNARLMGVPWNMRYAVLDQWLQQFVSTGHIDADRLEKMCENVVVGANIDGSEIKMSDLFNMQHYKTITADYRKQFMTKEKLQIINTFVNQGVAGKMAYTEFLQKMMIEDPDNAPSYASLQGTIFAQIDAAERRRQAEQQRTVRNATTHELNTSNIVDAYNHAFKTGNTYYNGVNIDTLIANAKPEAKADAFNRILNDIRNIEDPEDKAKAMINVMTFKPFSAFKSTQQQVWENTLNALTLSDDGGVSMDTETQKRLMEMFSLYKADPANMRPVFGESLYNQMNHIDTLAKVYGGDFDSALIAYTKTKQIPADEKKEYIREGYDALNGYRIEGMSMLNNSNITDAPSLDNNETVKRAIAEGSVLFRTQGLSVQSAVNDAAELVRDSYFAFHKGIIPKEITYNLGIDATEDNPHGDRYYMAVALEDYCAQFNDTGYPNSEVEVNYNPITREFTFLMGNTILGARSLDAVRTQAIEWYFNDKNNPKSKETEMVDGGNVTETAEELASKGATANTFTINNRLDVVD